MAAAAVELRTLPGVRSLILLLTNLIHTRLQDGMNVVLGSLTVHPVHFVIKGGAAAEIHLGTTDYTDIDTGLYISPDFSLAKRKLLRKQAIDLVLDQLIHIFQSDDPAWRLLWNQIEAAGFTHITLPGFRNNVMLEGYSPEPLFNEREGVQLSNECPFGIWIRQNVTAGSVYLELDLISVVLNVNLQNIHNRVVLDIAIPHIKSENAHSNFLLSEPVMKTVIEGDFEVSVPLVKPLSVYVDQYSASRSPEVNAGKTARRALRAERVLTNILTPSLADAASPVYSNMTKYGNLNRFATTQKLPSKNTHPENTFSAIVQKVRNVAPTPELRTPPPIPLRSNGTPLPITAASIRTGGGPGAQGGGTAAATRRRPHRRYRRTQRRR